MTRSGFRGCRGKKGEVCCQSGWQGVKRRMDSRGVQKKFRERDLLIRKIVKLHVFDMP